MAYIHITLHAITVQPTVNVIPDPLMGALPFLSIGSNDLYLLPGEHDTSRLDELVRLGALTSYRYVDAIPNPAILAIKPRS